MASRRGFPLWLCSVLVFCCVIFQVSAQIKFPSAGRPNKRPVFNTPRPIQPTPDNSGKTSGCNCLSSSRCPSGFGQLQEACVTEHGDSGICCLPQSGVTLTRQGFSAEDVQPVTFSSNDVTTAFGRGQTFFNQLMTDERTRLRNGQFLPRTDPARSHAFFFERRASSQRLNDLAYTIAQSSRELAQMDSLTPAQSFFNLPTTQVTNRQMGFQCPLNEPINCDPNQRYRTTDGSCNNLRKPILGRSETGFGRLSQALYEDGIISPRVTSVDGTPLPNVRKVSSSVLLDLNIPNEKFSLGVMQWSQFVDHDFSHAPFDDMGGEAIECCRNGRLVSKMPFSCFPIVVPEDDDFYRPRGQRCINFVRSMLALNEGCSFGPVEQLDVLTHWVDGSMIYGSTKEEEERVVDRATGFMRVSKYDLPPINRTTDCNARNPQFPCFNGGDSRITEQPALTTMHTVWIREHNRIAKFLRGLNRNWGGNKLFEETRRIVIAEVQHISYAEWLPLIIGENLVKRLGINVLNRGFRNSYDPSVDPRISNEFATAVFRFGHSLVQGDFKVFSKSLRQSTMRLRDTFNAPDILQRNPDLVNQFVRSLTLQNIQTLDSRITQDLSNHLFQTSTIDFGMDLMSLNVQRGREHAIATYNQMREQFGPGKAQTFFDLLSTTSKDLVRRIQSVYSHVDDIDLFIGGMTETPTEGAMLGPTFGRIVGEQFKALMNGDRFFYDMGGQAGSFTPEQLQEIRKISLARIYCDNSEVDEMQPEALKSVKRSNQRVPCNGRTIPSINLDVFKFD